MPRPSAPSVMSWLTWPEGSAYLFANLTGRLGLAGQVRVMRLGVAVIALIAAGLAFGIMTDAIVFHRVSPLGIEPYGDGGMLFKEAVFTWAMALFILWVKRHEVRALIGRLPFLGARAAA